MSLEEKSFKSTQYPSIGTPFDWWRRPLPPIISFIILAVIVIMVFLIGIWFAVEYIKIWTDMIAIPLII